MIGANEDPLKEDLSESWGKKNRAILMLPIKSLLIDDSPRYAGENEQHVRLLAESEEELPPIVVHGPTKRVIDGRHRLQAAIMRGKTSIAAKMYYGTDEDAFILAVRLNVTHGMPLTYAERSTAARRILGSHSHWSNRMIATATGISAGSVAKIRECSTAHDGQSNTRIGRDGRERPVGNAAGRERVGLLLARKPGASVRAIAAEAGVSPSTVHAVRRRLRVEQPSASQPDNSATGPTPYRPVAVDPPRSRAIPPAPVVGVGVATILAGLQADPTLRLSVEGRTLLRWLARYRVEEAESSEITGLVPARCAGSVAALARTYAQEWADVAEQLERRWSQQSG